MENTILVVHLLLALALIGVVLIQRSEGGGLGIGGGGGRGGLVTGRGVATALTKVTWILAIAFICTSIGLTVLNTRAQNNDSVLERLGEGGLLPSDLENGGISLPPSLEGVDLLPPASGDGPALPPLAE